MASDIPFLRADVTFIQSDAWAFDNLRFSTEAPHAVPEPATLTLFGLATMLVLLPALNWLAVTSAAATSRGGVVHEIAISVALCAAPARECAGTAPNAARAVNCASYARARRHHDASHDAFLASFSPLCSSLSLAGPMSSIASSTMLYRRSDFDSVRCPTIRSPAARGTPNQGPELEDVESWARRPTGCPNNADCITLLT